MNKHQEQEYYYQLGLNILVARKATGISQEMLANKLGVSRTTMVNIEKGRHRTLIHVLVEISEALNVKLESLLPSRTMVMKGDKVVSATLPKIITDKDKVDSQTEQAVADFVLFLNDKK